MSKIFSPANLHRLIAVAVGGLATSAQAILLTGNWTFKSLLIGMVGGLLIGIFGWIISVSKDATPPTAALLAFLLPGFLLIGSCSPPQADAAPVMASGPIGLSGMLAPGDSLGPYTFTVAPVAGATGYSWTVTTSATNGAWSNVPTGLATVSPTVTFTLASGGVWDSVSLQLCVKGTSSVRSAKSPACTTWKVSRYLASPTALTGDSSKLGPISQMTRSPTQDSIQRSGRAVFAHTTTAGSVQFCTFIRFGSGHVAGITPSSACAPVATANFASARLGALTPAEAGWLSGTCLTWASCLSGLSIGRVARDALLVHWT